MSSARSRLASDWRAALAVCLCLGLGGVRASGQGSLVVIEIRRTFASPACDSGEIHVNGRRLALFLSDPALFARPNLTAQVLFAEAATQVLAAPSTFYKSTNGVAITGDNHSDGVRLALLDGASFSPYSRRQLTRRLPADVLAVGFAVANRTCTVTANASDEPFLKDEDAQLAQTTNRFGQALFGVSNLAENFPTKG